MLVDGDLLLVIGQQALETLGYIQMYTEGIKKGIE